MKRAWMIILAAIVAYGIAGIFLDMHSGVDSVLANVAVTAVPCAAVLFVLVYTVMGIRGNAKWWKNEIGTTIVVNALAIFSNSVMLFWAELFNHGSINGPVSAWVYIGGLLLSASMLLWRTWVWLRIRPVPLDMDAAAAVLAAALAEHDHVKPLLSDTALRDLAGRVLSAAGV